MSGRIPLGFVILAAVVGWTPAQAGAPGPAGSQVAIEHFKFGQPTLSVPVGTTVTWVNRDEEPHTVTSTAGAFASPGLDNGERFTYRFDTPGTYVYYCAFHPHMRAQVVVQ